MPVSSSVVSNIAGCDVTALAREFGTPTYLYDASIIERRISEIKSFDVIRYAQKACSNLALLALMKKHGVVVDAVTAGEIHRALKVGYTGTGDPAGIVYTADLLDRDAIALIRQYGIPVNVGSPDMLPQLAECCPEVDVILRLNPGFGHGHSQKVNTGGPLSKHGIWHEQLGECLRMGRDLGLRLSGLHMHIGSGSDFEHLSQVCDAMVMMATEFGPQLKSVSAGGGLPIPYRRGESRIDVPAYFRLWDQARRRMESPLGHRLKLEVEPGRYLVAESGTLLTEIRAIKKMGDNLFYVVDAGFDNLIRPAFYGSYHEIAVAHAGSAPGGEREAIVAGPLCESGDVFTQEEGGVVVKRLLPAAAVGDYLVIQDTGAYGAAMASNYNSRRLAAEVLLREGNAQLIRERQSIEHLLANERIPAELL